MGSVPLPLGFPTCHSKFAVVEAIKDAGYMPVSDFLFKENNWLVGQKFYSVKMTCSHSENEDRGLAVWNMMDVISRCSDKKKRSLCKD